MQKHLIIVLGVTLVAFFGWLDQMTGPEVPLFIFYLVPLGLVSWNAGGLAGSLIAVLSGASWYTSFRQGMEAHLHFGYEVWGLSVRVGLFLVVNFFVSRFHTSIDHLTALASTDHLTGIANSRAFYQVVEKEIARARRYERSLSLAYIDCDNFKTVNDTLGHSAGDRLIRSLAQSIKHSVRNTDEVGRIGGDEFAILLPETDAESARVVMERVHQYVQGVLNEQGNPVTLSIGVVSYVVPPNRVDTLIRHADEAQYAAKHQGKNAVCYMDYDDLNCLTYGST